MVKLKTKHFLTGTELSREELMRVVDFACQLKEDRRAGKLRSELTGKSLMMLFEKPSLRTHVSFTVAMQEVGGRVVESFSFNRKHEEPEDQARVISGYCHGIVLRTHEHRLIERMAEASGAPVINGLSDSHHPCQVVADIQTLKENFGRIEGLKLAYVGDGNNMLHSILLLMPYLGMEVRFCCPRGYEPNALILKEAKKRALEGGGKIVVCNSPEEAVEGVHAIYTDVWTSMGFEEERDAREQAFEGFQVDEKLYAKAAEGAVVMHCMPMVRGKEISESLVDHPKAVLFQQSENRLHAQKSLLLALLAG